MLLLAAGAEVDSVDNDGKTPLLYAGRFFHERMIMHFSFFFF